MDEPWASKDVDRWWEDAEDRARRSSARANRLAWLGVILLSFLVFKLTANPALTTVVGCLKFGWDDFRVYLYLRTTDPDPVRARVCSRFYLASGFWRVTAVAIALPIVIAILTGIVAGGQKPAANRPVGAPPHPAFLGAMLTAFFGLFVSSFLTTWTMISSYARQVRVWVGPEPRRARELRFWPPRTEPGRPAPRNRIGLQVTCTVITWLMTAITFGLLLIPPDVARTAQALVVGFLFVLLMVSLPILVVVLRAVEERRIIAVSPEDCWGLATDPIQPTDGGWHAAT